GASAGAGDAWPEPYWGAYNLEFFAGMAIAYWLRRDQPRRYKVAFYSGLVLFTLAGIAEDLDWMNGYGTPARLGFGIPSALIVLGCAEASRRSTARVPFVLRELGAASYAIYLFHFIIIGLAWKVWQGVGLDRSVPAAIGFLVFSSGAIVAGIAISRLVEYPLIHAIRGFADRRWVREPVNVDAAS
ncbi:MAG: hypothetical protein QOH05_2766, partial [Acetobacteraceae bacterium]|nr:hypothetical protein [Acetobacteraceae bacterium]